MTRGSVSGLGSCGAVVPDSPPFPISIKSIPSTVPPHQVGPHMLAPLLQNGLAGGGSSAAGAAGVCGQLDGGLDRTRLPLCAAAVLHCGLGGPFHPHGVTGRQGCTGGGGARKEAARSGRSQVSGGEGGLTPAQVGLSSLERLRPIAPPTHSAAFCRCQACERRCLGCLGPRGAAGWLPERLQACNTVEKPNKQLPRSREGRGGASSIFGIVSGGAATCATATSTCVAQPSCPTFCHALSPCCAVQTGIVTATKMVWSCRWAEVCHAWQKRTGNAAPRGSTAASFS